MLNLYSLFNKLDRFSIANESNARNSLAQLQERVSIDFVILDPSLTFGSKADHPKIVPVPKALAYGSPSSLRACCRYSVA